MSQIYAPGSIAGPPAAFMGPYNSGTAYAVGQAVSSAGSSYVSLAAANVGHVPATSPVQWAILAAGGAPGSNGAPGAPGTNGQVTNAALAAAVGLMSRTSDGGVNQLNLATCVANTLINADGTTSANGGFTTTGFITATGPLMITNFNLVGNGRPVCCYDISQNFLGGATTVGGSAWSLPDPTTPGTVIQLVAGTAYVRFTGYTGHPNSTDMVVFGDAAYPPALPGSYVGFARIASSAVDSKIALAVGSVGPAAGAQITASLPRGRNLYDVSLRSDGYFLSSWPTNGALEGAGTYTPLSTTGFIPIAGLATIYCNAYVVDQHGGGEAVAFYDANQQFISFTSGEAVLGHGLPNGFLPNTPISVPSNAVYARLTSQFANGDGTLALVAPSAMMVMATATPAAYQPFGYDLPAVVDSKIATAVGAANAAIQAQFAALGGGLGAVHENRPAQVAIVEGQNLGAGASQILFSATGAGSVERLQLAYVNTLQSASKLTEMEACTLTITVDGTVFTSTVGMFFLNIGISDANPANEVFSTKWLERSISNQEAQQGVGRRIYIPYQTSCSIVFNVVATAPMDIYTQVDYYKGAPLPGLHAPNRKVFHMATTEWRDSVGLTPYQQIQLLTTAATGPGVLEHWHIAASCDARSIANSPGWLEANPGISFDGTSFGAGGTEDFFGTQYYGIGLQTKANEFSFSLFTSAKTGLTYTLLARHFDQFPIPFTSSLGPVTWSNGQGGEGVTPLPNLKCGMQIVWYTAA